MVGSVREVVIPTATSCLYSASLSVFSSFVAGTCTAENPTPIKIALIAIPIFGFSVLQALKPKSRRGYLYDSETDMNLLVVPAGGIIGALSDYDNRYSLMSCDGATQWWCRPFHDTFMPFNSKQNLEFVGLKNGVMGAVAGDFLDKAFNYFQGNFSTHFSPVVEQFQMAKAEEEASTVTLILACINSSEEMGKAQVFPSKITKLVLDYTMPYFPKEALAKEATN